MPFRAADPRLALVALFGLAAAAAAQTDDGQGGGEGGTGQAQQLDGAVDEALLAKALKIPARDLAGSFLVNRYLIKLTELAGANVRIHTPEGTIDQRSAAARRRESEARLAAYRHAIMQRGFASLAGVYAVDSVSPACARAGSLWLGGAQEGIFEKYEIVQDSFELTLNVTLAPQPGQPAEGKTFGLEGVVVESALVFEDPMNSDYFLDGKAADGRITIKPRPDVVNSWPEWAGPPKKRDLENCSLVLRREDDG